LITDSGIDNETKAKLEELGIDVVVEKADYCSLI
jgi:hypothetical protein